MENTTEVIKPSNKSKTLATISLVCFFMTTLMFYICMICLFFVGYSNYFLLAVIIFIAMVCFFTRHIGFYCSRELNKKFSSYKHKNLIKNMYDVLLFIDGLILVAIVIVVITRGL